MAERIYALIKTNEDGFKIFDGAGDEWGPFLVIETRRIKDCVEYLRKTGITRIHLNSFHGYEAPDLQPVSSLGFIDGLTTPDDLDFGELRRFRNLRVLGLPDNGIDTIDLSWFKSLEQCAVTYSKRLLGLADCEKLRNLTLTDYDSKKKDFGSFPTLPLLEEFVLIRSKIQRFDGLGRLLRLRYFNAALMYNLVSIAGLGECRDTLEVVILENCKRIEDLEEIGQLTRLRKLILSECSQLESLKFILRLPDLEFLSFWGTTKILDGDLSYCIEHPTLRYAGFDNKRHYSHKFEQVKLLLSKKKESPSGEGRAHTGSVR